MKLLIMSNFFSNKISKDFWHAVAAVIGIITIAAGCLFFYNYRALQEKMRYTVSSDIKKIETFLTDSLNFTKSVLAHVGEKIIEQNKNTHKEATDLISIYEKSPLRTWTSIGWNSSKGTLLFDTQGKFHSKWERKSQRSYDNLIEEFPWRIHLSHPTIGITSGLYIIPVAMGITNKKKEYLGHLSSGINLIALSEKLAQVAPNATFLLVDSHHKIILNSQDMAVRYDRLHIKSNLKNIIEGQSSGEIQEPFIQGDIIFTHLLKLPEQELTILCGFNHNLLIRNFILSNIPSIIEIIIILLFFIILLYFYHQRIVKSAVVASDTQEEFFSSVVSRMNGPLISALGTCKEIKSIIEGELIEKDTASQKIDYVQNILRKLIAPMQENLGRKKFDAKKCLLKIYHTCHKEARKKSIVFETETSFQTLLIEADEHKFKQIVLGLVFAAIDQTPKKGSISIEAKKGLLRKNDCLEISVKDNGFGLSNDYVSEIFQKANKRAPIKTFIGERIDLERIQHLVLMHHGEFDVDHTLGEGKVITIKLPLFSSHNTHTSPQDSNIYDITR